MVKTVQKLGVRNVGFGAGYDLLAKSLQPALYYSEGFGRSGDTPNLRNLDGTTGAYYNFIKFADISHVKFTFVAVAGGGGGSANPPHGLAGDRVWQVAREVNFPAPSKFRYQFSEPITTYPDGLHVVAMTVRPANEAIYSDQSSLFGANSIVGNSDYAVALGFQAFFGTGASPSPYDYVQAVKMYPDTTTPSEVLRAFPLINATIATDNHRNAVVPWSRWDNATMFVDGKFTTFMGFWANQPGTVISRRLIRWLPSATENDAVVDTVVFSDALDNDLMNTNYPGFPASGLFNDCCLKIVAHEGKGFYAVIDAIVAGERVAKYYHIDPTFSYYYELVPFALDATAATYLLDANRRFTYVGAVPDGDALTMTVQPSVLAARVLAGTYEQPDWPNPGDVAIRAWAFTLDGHDFYVLKLGKVGKTLVYDLSTKQISHWADEDLISWRPEIGLNWESGGTIPQNFGTSVIIGDSENGQLWVLDPDHGLDEDLPFTRIATAQIPIEGRDQLPVYNVFLTASTGEPALTANTFRLDYSDDEGDNYNLAGEVSTVVQDDYEREYSWRSLGRVVYPGRLFRLTDDGAFARVDSLDINEG